jgi:hypothetical protein
MIVDNKTQFVIVITLKMSPSGFILMPILQFRLNNDLKLARKIFYCMYIVHTLG